MCKMKYLYEYCSMEECINKVKKKDNRNHCIFEDAEEMALDYQSYPKKWPWLE